jgi:hypothetical protein
MPGLTKHLSGAVPAATKKYREDLQPEELRFAQHRAAITSAGYSHLRNGGLYSIVESAALESASMRSLKPLLDCFP